MCNATKILIRHSLYSRLPPRDHRATVLGEVLISLQWFTVALVVGASIGMVLTSKTVKAS